MKLIAILILWGSLALAACADGEVLLKMDLSSTRKLPLNKSNKRSVQQVMRVKDGGTAVLDLKPENGASNMREQWKFRPVLADKERIRVESQLEVKIGDGPTQRSKFAATLLEGEPWEATVDDPSGDATLEYHITVWRIPADCKFAGFDKTGHPKWTGKN